jgi:CelD/BcsL family acetyltransferase involved in cellulose biosynthesis
MTVEAVESQGEVVDVAVVTDRRWHDLTAGRRSDVFHSPAWAGVLADTYGMQVRARILHAAGRTLAGMAYVTVDDHLGVRHVTLPFSDFCDPLVDDSGQLRKLIGDLLDGPDPLSIRCLFDDASSALPELTEAHHLGWHRIDVTRSEADMWDAIDPGARRAIRKATAAGLTVRPARSIDDVRLFFELHLRVRKYKYRLLSQPWRFFQSIWERFLAPGDGILLLAEADDGRAVGGVLFLAWGDTLYYKFNASDPDNLDVRPNDLILWEGMRWAHEHGLAFVDLGVSDLDQPGLIRYKRKYATEEGGVTVRRKPAAMVPAGVEEARRLLGKMTELFVDESVPDDVTERAGDLLYRLFV